MGKHRKVKVIQIRVTEEMFNKFNKICEEDKDTSSHVGYKLIKEFLKVASIV